MKPIVTEKLQPTIQRLRVAGKFAEGITLTASACCDLAKALEYMAGYMDAQMALDELTETRRWYLRTVGKELLKCLVFVVVVCAFAMIGRA